MYPEAKLKEAELTNKMPKAASEGVEREYPLATAPEVWLGFQRMPMASNLQIVFYHNREGDVLVKFLFNEKETTIPSLSAVSGPYYKWEDVRSYFVSLLES